MVVARDLEHTLRSMDYEVVGIAGSGARAISLCAESRPEIVLMDIELKGDQDGIRAAEVIGQRFSIPVIYLTAHSDKYTVERARMTRPSAYIVKPYNPERLDETIQKALLYGSGQIGVVAGDANRKANVLLVDNSEYTQTVMMNLMGRNHRVKLSPTVRHAKDMIRQVSTPFDLILINMELADARGGAAVREMRRDMGVTSSMVVLTRRMTSQMTSFLRRERISGYVEKRPDFEFRLLQEVDRALGLDSEAGEAE